MSFAPDEDQLALAATVRALLSKRSDSAAVRAVMESDAGYDTGVWALLCEQVGAAALAIPEEYDGAGFTLAETQVVLEELGAALTPVPLLGSAVVAAQALLLSGNSAACAEFLPGIASGESVASLVWPAAHGRPTGSFASTDGLLTGSATQILDGDLADVLLVVADLDGAPALYSVDPAAVGVTREWMPSMDQTMRFASVTLSDVPGVLVLADATEVLHCVARVAAAAVTALQVGAMRAALDMTVAYSKERVQFGRPIGSFQALKHRMADMYVDLETSRSISWAAAQPGADAHVVATAKAWCSEALNKIASEMVQLHGGIAITWEHDAHLYFKRAHALSTLFPAEGSSSDRL
jgi:alkylation response protein AidB-like acyl-CoA dehydrogenase